MSNQNNIWEYLRGQRTGRQANRFEQEMLSDPFLYEAIEGLTSLEGDHEKIVKELEQKLEKNKKNKRSLPHHWWIAASFFILIGMAIFLINRNSDHPESVFIATLNILPTDTSEFFQELPSRNLQFDTLHPVSDKNEKQPSSTETRLRSISDPTPTNIQTTPRKSIPTETITRKDAHSPQVHVMTKSPGIIKDSVPPLFEKHNDSISSHTFIADTLQILPQRRNKRRIQPKRLNKQFLDKKPSEHLLWMQKFQQYVKDSLRYPQDALSQQLEGEVVLSVRLNRKGIPARIKLIRRLSPSCNREAIRLIESYPAPWEHTTKEILITIPFQLPKNP